MKVDLRLWSARLRRWGWITRDERRVGFVAAGFVASVDAVLAPKDDSGYPVVEGATYPLTFHTDGREVYKHGNAGGLRLRRCRRSEPRACSWACSTGPCGTPPTAVSLSRAGSPAAACASAAAPRSASSATNAAGGMTASP